MNGRKVQGKVGGENVREMPLHLFDFIFISIRSRRRGEKKLFYFNDWVSLLNALSISISHLYYYTFYRRRKATDDADAVAVVVIVVENDFRRFRQWGIIYYLSLSISYTSSHSNSIHAHTHANSLNSLCVCIAIFTELACDIHIWYGMYCINECVWVCSGRRKKLTQFYKSESVSGSGSVFACRCVSFSLCMMIFLLILLFVCGWAEKSAIKLE